MTNKWKNPLKYSVKEKAISDALIRKTKSIKHLLTPHQKLMYNLIFNSEERECGYWSSRKIGKTASLLLIQFEFCWKHSGAIVKHVLSNQTQATEIIEPIFSSFLKKVLPSDMLPEYKISRKTFQFKNGSSLSLCGAHPDNIEKSAGPSCDLMIFDEIAIWEGDIHHALFDILYPQGTLTKMKKIYACTPPLDIQSYYIQKIHPKLIDKKTLVTLTIDESPLLTPDEIEELAEQYGGRDSAEFRRQFLCQLIPSKNARLTPEFDNVAHVYEAESTPLKSITYSEAEIPQLYQYFLCADTGVADNTAILIGYLDHHNSRLVIEEELVQNNINLTTIAGEILYIKNKYTKFTYDEDCGMLVIIDAFAGEHKEFREIHGIQHNNPIKGKVLDNIAHLRSALQNDKILISHTCKRLIWELNNCVWKESISENKQIKRDSEQKHGDAIMALTYMLRAVNWRFRPDSNGFNFKFGGYNCETNGMAKLKESNVSIWTNLRYSRNI